VGEVPDTSGMSEVEFLQWLQRMMPADLKVNVRHETVEEWRVVRVHTVYLDIVVTEELE
jgi:hypothetical protein